MLRRCKARQLSGFRAASAVAFVTVNAWGADATELATSIRRQTAVNVRPGAIVLNAPPAVETQQSCVLYRLGGGELRVLAAESSDAAIDVSFHKDESAGTWVVSVLLPAGYEHPGKRPVEILVRTLVAAETPEGKPANTDATRSTAATVEQTIRIPVRVLKPPPAADHPAWLGQAREWIGRLCPVVVAELPKGGDVQFIPREGSVGALVFAAHYCEHCDVHMPIIEKVAEEYGPKGVTFFSVITGGGNGQGIANALERWGVHWTIGVDHGFRIAHQFGVRAYPVVFLIGKDGTIESIHGRHNNSGRDNGLDNLADDLRRELDILLAGGTRADFPVVKPASATRPASTTRPAMEAATTRPASGSIGAAPVVNPSKAG